MAKENNGMKNAKTDVTEAVGENTRSLGYVYSAIKDFKLKRVRLLVDSRGHSRELSPEANISPKFLKKNESVIINAIKIADSQECWSVRIPSNVEIAGVICSLYKSGKREDEEILWRLLVNYANVTMISDGLFHNLVTDCGTIFLLRNDTTLSAKEKRARYFSVLKSAVKTCLDDLDFLEKSQREHMEASNKAFEKLVEGTEE